MVRVTYDAMTSIEELLREILPPGSDEAVEIRLGADSGMVVASIDNGAISAAGGTVEEALRNLANTIVQSYITGAERVPGKFGLHAGIGFTIREEARKRREREDHAARL